MSEIESANIENGVDKGSAGYWRKLFEERKRSGKTVREYCAAEGIGYSLYYRWAHRLGYFKRAAAKVSEVSGARSVGASKHQKQGPVGKPVGKFVEVRPNGVAGLTVRTPEMLQYLDSAPRALPWEAEVELPNGAIVRASASLSAERLRELIGALVAPTLEGGAC